jgi:hypothetical protein
MTKVVVLGSGQVGEGLANGLLPRGSGAKQQATGFLRNDRAHAFKLMHPA